MEITDLENRVEFMEDYESPNLQIQLISNSFVIRKEEAGFVLSKEHLQYENDKDGITVK